jgi:hypothetical protein
MNTLDQIAIKIIKEQELIIGPIAWEEAGKVSGMHVDAKAHTLTIDSADGRAAIDGLVSQYEHFFGRAAREVCKEAAASLVADLMPAEVPSSLQ